MKEEVACAKEIVESVQQEDSNLNDRISEFVNIRFEEGRANGNVPNSDELSELFEYM